MSVLSNLSEKELETMMVENYMDLAKRGFPEMYANVKRQVRLPVMGIADILTWQTIDNVLFVRVIELKRDLLNFSALVQAIKYYSVFLGVPEGSFSRIEPEIILVGKNMDGDFTDFSILKVDKLKIYLYDFDYNGLFFNQVQNINPKTIEKTKASLSYYYKAWNEFMNSLAIGEVIIPRNLDEYSISDIETEKMELS